jgi:acyl-CoA thioester hydrolase
MKRHHCIVKTRWDDLDAFGHVNNATYLTYVQEARFDFTWYARKMKNEDPILLYTVVARAEIDFLIPIYDGHKDLDVSIWVGRIGNSSFTLKYEIASDGVVFARAETVQVTVDEKTHKSRSMSDEERAFLLEYQDESEQE